MANEDSTARAILAVATAPPQKSGGVAAVLWLLLAGVGGPWWYLGKPFSALFALFAYWTCFALIFVGVGIVLLPILCLVDGLAVWSTVKKQNSARVKLIRAAMAA